MTEPNNYQDWILETIDSLRSRKARPDLERICRMVRRRHGSDPDQTRAELEKLIQSQTVLKVSYKGSISYRNAAKVLRKSRKKSELATSSGGSSKQEHLNNSGDSAHRFIDPDQEEAAVGPSGPKLQPDSALSSGCNRATIAPDEQRASASSTDSGVGQQREGGSPPSRVGHIASNATPSRGDDSRGVIGLNNKTSKLASQRHAPSLKPKVRTVNSAVAPVRGLSAANRGHMKPLGLKDILGYLSSQERLCDEKLTRGKVKVVMEREVARGRLRRTRCGNITLPLRGTALDEPSDRGQEKERTVSEDKVWTENKDDQTEEVLLSYEEDAGISPVAMTTNPELIEKSAEDVGIQTTSKQLWAKGEPHPQVQGASAAALPEKSQGVSSSQEHTIKHDRTVPTSSSFHNLECNTEIDESSCLLTPTASPVDSALSDESGGFLRCDGLSGNLIEWTVSDVVNYFTAAGFPEQAVAFRTQEIDGKSLLLMQRNDVLTGLSIRLGPALKIYEHHVKALQKTHFEDDDL